MYEELEKKYEKYRKLIEERLSNHRYVHSLNVAKSSFLLAQKYGADEEKAYLAGLLHDICKEVSDEEQLKILTDFAIIKDSVSKSQPKLWHAITGSLYVKEILGIEDSDIINAIRYHTTGRASMSILEKVLYIADFISDDRTYEGVENLRLAAKESMEKAMDIALTFSIMELIGKGKPIHIDTLHAYNQLVMNKQD
jgi:nicotinate-nucleotide adenylyltransferase